MPATLSSPPVVVTVGFAGSRHLLAADAMLTPAQQADFHAALQQHLEKRLISLHADLKLAPRHFLCGISQVAIGGDTLFTLACAALPISQRIFLPQTRDEYLDAKNSDGVPDFTEAEKSVALALLASPHIIHEQVVSDSPNRTGRFEDANLKILRASDVLICLVRADADGLPGGTLDLLHDAAHLGKPVLEIRVAEKDAQPDFTEIWHHPRRPWSAPALPPELDGSEFSMSADSPSPGIPISSTRYLKVINGIGGRLADWQKSVFKKIAIIVIGAHLAATLCAVLALAFHHGPVSFLLLLELALLATGFLVHRSLHHSNTVRDWATSRLTAEIARSVHALRDIHSYLDYLFALPFPKELLPLLRTINILHLASSKHSAVSWEKCREHYLRERLDDSDAQLAYYRNALRLAESRLSLASLIFNSASILAFAATTTKLVLHVANFHSESVPTALGTLAILLPVLAVGALSLAASFDLEARVHTYHDTLEFLEATRPLFDAARTERAFVHLVMETEARLLGETANWASRRSFTSVT